MAYGGGNFTVQNKVLPGVYTNITSAKKATTFHGERGVVAIALELDWGMEDKVFEVTSEDFQKESMKFFGYDFGHEKLKGLRDMFLNTKKGLVYRLNKGAKAENTYATARYSGVRGNDIKVVVSNVVSETATHEVTLLFGNVVVDSQKVKTASELKDNDYVTWKKEASLTQTAGANLAGGTNGSPVEVSAYQSFLDKIESYTFNILALVSTNEQVKTLYSAFTKRMRDEVGAKFQAVLYNKKADYEGVINVKNNTIGDNEASLVYWVAGLEAACEVNKSCQNRKYDGEFEVFADYTQAQLEKAVLEGEFVLHKSNDDILVLDDINSFISFSEEKNKGFSSNQTIRVLDEIALSTAKLFHKKYNGQIPTDSSGLISLWHDLVKFYEELQKMGAIKNFDEKDVEVNEGAADGDVVTLIAVQVATMMKKLYMYVKLV